KLNGQTKENPTDWDSCWQHVDGRSLIVTGGFPCQPWSVAGRRGGADDERHLWPEMLRVIREIHPRWVIAENVPGLDGEQMGLDAVLDDLEDVGYETQTLEIPACAVGAPHIRRRLWIVAHASSAREEIRKSRALERSSRRSGLLRNADSKRQQEQRRPIPGHERTRRQESKLPNWWLTEPDVGRVAHGIPSRVDRLRALGNAIVPQIAEIIGKAIMEVEHGQEKPMAQTP
nr:hypothetical protein [Burkholderiales bacterium]